MNEFEPVAHVDFQFAEILKFIGYGILGFMVWLLKKFGEQHLLSMKELANELKEMRKEINSLSTRVTAVEVRTEKLRHDES